MHRSPRSRLCMGTWSSSSPHDTRAGSSGPDPHRSEHKPVHAGEKKGGGGGGEKEEKRSERNRLSARQPRAPPLLLLLPPLSKENLASALSPPPPLLPPSLLNSSKLTLQPHSMPQLFSRRPLCIAIRRHPVWQSNAMPGGASPSLRGAREHHVHRIY